TVLVKGNIQGSGDRIAIRVTMDDVTKNRQMLNQEFLRDRQDLLTLEDSVFRAVVNALAITQSNEERARTTSPTEDIGAYELYLKGRNLWRGQQNQKSLERAVSLFDQAVKTDPQFALAYTGLADAYLRLWDQTKDDVWPL